jgi:hypothetical protein
MTGYASGPAKVVQLTLVNRRKNLPLGWRCVGGTHPDAVIGKFVTWVGRDSLEVTEDEVR